VNLYKIHLIFKQYYIPILIALASKIVVLFGIGGLGLYLIHNRGNINIWELWNVWDAPHYLSVATFGYQKVGVEANFIIYLPLFPILIYIFKLLFQTSYLISGYIVSLLASILLAIMLYKLTVIDYSKKIALFAVLILFIFPTSFFLHIPYTESLFILLSVAAFYFAREKKYWISFIFIGLATTTKVAGLALFPAILTEILVFDRQNFHKKNLVGKLTILFLGSVISVSGFIVYLLINYVLWGNIFQFTIFQKQNWYEDFAPFGQGLVNTYQSLSWRQGLEKLTLGYAQIAAFFFALVISIYVLMKIRLSYGLFMLVNLFFYYSMSYWICMPRYILTLFPMYIALALFFKNIFFRYFWILFSVILLFIFSLIFIQYGPVL